MSIKASTAVSPVVARSLPQWRSVALRPALANGFAVGTSWLWHEVYRQIPVPELREWTFVLRRVDFGLRACFSRRAHRLRVPSALKFAASSAPGTGDFVWVAAQRGEQLAA